MAAFLTIVEGPHTGARFPLLEDRPNLVGRDRQCVVVLEDPKCSRVHACIYREEGAWWIEDRGSSNGTFVNGRKIDTAQLVEGTRVAVGRARFELTLGDPELSRGTQLETATGSIETEWPQRPEDTGQFLLSEMRGLRSGEDLFQLFQLTYWLLSQQDPEEVIRECLTRLREHTGASVAGFLWLDDHGTLRPQIVLPEERSGDLALDELASELISRRRHALRIESTAAVAERGGTGCAQSIWVPLLDGDQVRGAIALGRDTGRFSPAQSQWASSLANVLVRSLVRARKQRTLEQDHQRLQASVGDTGELIGDSPSMLELRNRIRRVARAAGCVLIRGESGVGKELVARAIHRSSPRADRPMLSVNCAAIPADLMESQLFGHKRGAFTSADSDHAGFFQQADSGTLFLDEVGELTLEGQAKLLRILEGHPFLPVGGTKEVTVDVRVLAATNRDLREYVAERKFREDLYYRLSVFELAVPSLRERGADIDVLIRHFFEHFKREHGRADLQLDDEAHRRLLAYRWPGNVRQLRNVIDSAVVMAEGDRILAEELALRGTEQGGFDSLRIDVWERRLIEEALQRTSNRVPEAALLLGLSRATLYRKIEEYGIHR